jgi:phospholipid transport system substrate-binding protein
MILKYLFHVIMLFILAFTITLPVLAGEPTEQIRQTTDKIIAVLNDPALKEPERAEERKNLVRQAVYERFDWEEMTRRSLARHWSKRTDEEKQEFISLYAQLLERTYLDRVEGYSGETVSYEDERVEGEYGIIKVKVTNSKDVEIPVKYRVRKKGDVWLVYDVYVEGVSLVNNYRVQFNSIITRSSYDKLVKKLKNKIAQK